MQTTSQIRIRAMALFVLTGMGCGVAFASGLQPIGTSADVFVQRVTYDVEVRGAYVSGVFEVEFRTETGDENSANFRFPLPEGGVIHKAEIYLPAQERWETAETCGRREGEDVYNDITEEEEPVDPLLVQQIGANLYRARVFPIDASGDLRIRIHYAHMTERTETGSRLRIAFASADAMSATPAEGVRVTATLEPHTWDGGTWYDLNDPAWVKDFDGGAGCATLVYDELFTMDRDLVLELSGRHTPPRAGALRYVPLDSSLEDHVHAWWTPDFGAWPSAMSAPRSVVFVIDRSGSMSGMKIEETKRAVVTCLNQLAPEDTFGVVAFSSSVVTFRGTMSPASDAALGVSWVRSLTATGGTNISRGLSEGAAVAATGPNENAPIDLLLITDANANLGTTTSSGILSMLANLTEQYGREIRVFGCGMGSDVVQTFVNELALQTNAESTFALDDAEITGQITDLFARVRGGGVGSVTASIEYVGAVADAGYGWLRVFSEMLLDDDCTLALSGTCTDGTPVSTSVAVDPDSYDDAFDRIAAPLAARTWADRLELEADLNGETPALVDEAVVLAKTYGIVTRYSSLLALETEQLYVEYDIETPLRDEAGIALEPVSPSVADESRIGGAGTQDSLYTGGWYAPAPAAAMGCAAAGRASGAGALAVAFVAAALVALRRRRTADGRRAA